MKVLEFFTFLLTIASGYAWWRNSWDGVLNFRCPQHHGVYGSISRIKSHHHNGKEDRQWDFECNYDIRTQSSCSWPHDFVNGWDAELQYECPKYGYIAGAYSYHDNHREDRRWKYYCCDVGLKQKYLKNRQLYAKTFHNNQNNFIVPKRIFSESLLLDILHQ